MELNVLKVSFKHNWNSALPPRCEALREFLFLLPPCVKAFLRHQVSLAWQSDFAFPLLQIFPYPR